MKYLVSDDRDVFLVSVLVLLSTVAFPHALSCVYFGYI